MRALGGISLASAVVWWATACGGGGGGGGAVSCADGGSCPPGTSCGPNGFCVSSGTGGAGGGTGGVGGSSGVGGSGGASAVCTQVCDAYAAANCPNAPADCLAACEQERQQYSGCIGAFDGLALCLLGSGFATCDADGEPQLLDSGGACSAQASAFSDCVNGGTGGAGGGMGGAGGAGGSGGGVGGTGGAGGGMGGVGGGTGGVGGGTGGVGGGTGGVGGTGGSGGSGGACNSIWYGLTCTAISSGYPSCDVCAGTYCCSQLNSCLADAQCAQAMYCYMTNCAGSSDPIGCGTSQCSACYTLSGPWLGVYSCLSSNCPSQCDPILP